MAGLSEIDITPSYYQYVDGFLNGLDVGVIGESEDGIILDYACVHSSIWCIWKL
jgi:hypothetical protein